MADQKVVNFMKEQLSNGFTMEEIRKGLISQGWAKFKVDDAAQEVTESSEKQAQKAAKKLPQASSGNAAKSEEQKAEQAGKESAAKPAVKKIPVTPRESDYGTDRKSETAKAGEGGKKVPGFVRFFGILYYISAAFMVLIAAASVLLMLGIGNSILGFAGLLSGFLSAGITIAIAAPSIAFAALNFFVGRGLFKGKKWARIVAIVFSIIGFLLSAGSILSIKSIISNSSYSSAISMVPGGMSAAIAPVIICLALSGLMASYLVFSKKAKEAFLQSGQIQKV